MSKEINPVELDFLLRFPSTPNVTTPVDFMNNWSWGGIKVSNWFVIPAFFLQIERDIVIASVRLSICLSIHPSVCLLCYLLNHWTKFNQIWCLSYSHEWACNSKFFFGPTPEALRRGQKVKYHFKSITKSISKIFITNFGCVLTNERYKTYQTGFSFCGLGHAPGVGHRGCPGGQKKKNFFSSNMFYIYFNL